MSDYNPDAVRACGLSDIRQPETAERTTTPRGTYDSTRPATWPDHELDAWLEGRRWIRFTASRFAGRPVLLLLDPAALTDARAAHPRTAIFTIDEATRLLARAPTDEQLRAILALKAGTDGEFVFDPAPSEPIYANVRSEDLAAARPPQKSDRQA